MKKSAFIILLISLGMLTSSCQFLSDILPPPNTLTETPVAATTEALAPYSVDTTQTSQPTAAFPEQTATQQQPGNPTPVTQPQYILQPGTPVYLPNFNQPEAGCDWIGVAGQVFDADGGEVLGLVIHSGDEIAITGEMLAYGPGGYEIQLSDSPENTTSQYWVQVFNTEGQTFSDQVFFNTYADCSQNLILVNFVTADLESQPEQTPTLEAYP